jgi:hypothetical protein
MSALLAVLSVALAGSPSDAEWGLLREPVEPKSSGCIAAPNIGGGTLPGFMALAHTRMGPILATGDGTLRLAQPPSLPVIFDAKKALLALAVAEGMGEIAATGFEIVVRSSDGGKSFRLEDAPQRAVAHAVAFAGRDLLIFDVLGRGFRSHAGGPYEPLRLPRTVTYLDVSFADARKGYLVGTCGTLLETLDGGSTWTMRNVPSQSPLNVFARGDTLFVSGPEGLFRSDNRGRSFEQVIPRGPCGRMDVSGTAAVVACSRLGESLWYASDGRRFRPVRIPPTSLLFGATFDGAGFLLGAGAGEMLVRATSAGGERVYDSPVVQLWLRIVEETRAGGGPR